MSGSVMLLILHPHLSLLLDDGTLLLCDSCRRGITLLSGLRDDASVFSLVGGLRRWSVSM